MWKWGGSSIALLHSNQKFVDICCCSCDRSSEETVIRRSCLAWMQGRRSSEKQSGTNSSPAYHVTRRSPYNLLFLPLPLPLSHSVFTNLSASHFSLVCQARIHFALCGLPQREGQSWTANWSPASLIPLPPHTRIFTHWTVNCSLVLIPPALPSSCFLFAEINLGPREKRLKAGIERWRKGGQ